MLKCDIFLMCLIVIWERYPLKYKIWLTFENKWVNESVSEWVSRFNDEQISKAVSHFPSYHTKNECTCDCQVRERVYMHECVPSFKHVTTDFDDEIHLKVAFTIISLFLSISPSLAFSLLTFLSHCLCEWFKSIRLFYLLFISLLLSLALSLSRIHVQSNWVLFKYNNIQVKNNAHF